MLAWVPPPLGPVSDSAAAGSRDGNDSFATAQQVYNNSQTPPSYLSASDDPNDYYWIEMVRGQAVEAHFIILKNDSTGYDYTNPGKVNFDLEIFGPKDTSKPLAWSRTTDQFEIESIVAAVDGKYYFRAYAVNGSGDYVFLARLYTPPTVKDGGVYSGYLKQSSNHDSDWYRVYLKGGGTSQTIKAVMDTDNTGNLDLYLMDLWSEDKLYYVNVSWAVGVFREEVYGVASYSGYYYIRVHAFSGYGNYQVKVTLGNVTTDNDNDKGHATLLEYNATWTDHVDQAMDKYDYFELRLQPQETVRLDLWMLSSWDDIYSLFLLDVATKVIVERTNYIFTPQHDTGPNVTFDHTVEGGVYYVVVMSKVALMSNPDDLSDETAASDYRLVVNMSKHLPKPPNKAPVVRPGHEDYELMMDEDTAKWANLNDVFSDPDGDKLVFEVDVEDGQLTASVDMSGLLTVIPGADWSGTGHINMTAADPGGLKVSLLAKVTVVARPEPPIVKEYGPARNARLKEGQATLFYVNVTDKDSSVIFYNWTVDGVDQHRADRALPYSPDYSSAGPHTVVARISDGTTVVTWEWSISVENVNRAPNIISVEPQNGTKFKAGRSVHFRADLNDPDGDLVSYEWREGLQLLSMGTGPISDFNKSFSSGKHTVRLTISDPSGAMATSEIAFTMKEKEETLDWWIWLVVTLIVVVVAFIVYAFVGGPRRVDKKTWDEDIEKELGKSGKRKPGKEKGKKGHKKEREETLDEGLEEDIEREVRAERKRMKRGKKGT